MDRIRNIEPTQNRSEILAAIVSPRVKQPVAGILKKKNNNNISNSVYDVEDFSFDDTQDLCESRSRLFATADSDKKRLSRSKRSRSGGRRDPEEATVAGGPVLENIASPRKDANFVARKKARRSRSVVAFELEDSNSQAGDDTDIELGRQQRAYSLTEKTEAQRRRESLRSGLPSPVVKQTALSVSGEQLHNFVQKTVLKPEKCSVCLKRIKFGKIYLKCPGCRMTIHSECTAKAPPLCARGSQSPEVCVTPRVEGSGGGLARSPSKKAYFASPMLR